MKYFTTFIVLPSALLLNIQVSSQPAVGKNSFRSPLDFPLSVSGNFGEIRADHFHSGIDIRTQGVTGKKIYATADGYISRIKIESGGYGKTLYLIHPNGLMTVYAHLERFNPEIEKYVKDRQYEEKKHAINIFPFKNDFPVTEGKHIAYSGNTGYSFGPHLHFEIRNAGNQNIRNVMLYDLGINDRVAPKFFSLCLYPMEKNSFVNNAAEKQIIPVSGENEKYRIPEDYSLRVTGKIGFGIEAYDYINGSASRCGIYIIELYVDSTLVNSCLMDEFSFNESRYINSFIDYEEKQKSGRNIQKAFIEPNNKLSVYRNDVNKGLVEFSDDNPHLISFVIKDTYLNTSRLDFTVMSQSDNNVSNREIKNDFIQYMHWESLNVFERDDIRLIIPEGALYKDLEFQYSRMESGSGLFSAVHNLHNIYTPLHLQSELSIRPENFPESLQEKAILVKSDKEGKWQYTSGEWDNGFVKGMIPGFGNYAVSIDTSSPVIKPLNFSGIPDLSDMNSILFKVKDELSGIMSYEGYIDGDWALFEYDAKNDLVFYKFDPERISKEQNHELELYVIDNKQNINFYYTEFYW
jgi:murein DD-endopeptidase MepM/ murein hydrolase activator NlpD